MKKILSTLLIFILLVSCGKNDYIKAVKSAYLTEPISVSNIEIADVCDISSFYIHKLTGEDYFMIRNNLQFEVGENLEKNTKLVKISYKNAIAEVIVTKDENNQFSVKSESIIARYKDKIYNSDNFYEDYFLSKYNDGVDGLKNFFNDFFETIKF